MLRQIQAGRLDDARTSVERMLLYASDRAGVRQRQVGQLMQSLRRKLN